jgi:DNA helicase-2/ATP-dependent DNA helicase PcrA
MQNNLQVEWFSEKENLEITVDFILKRIIDLENQSQVLKTEVIDLRKHFWDDITMDHNNLFDTYVSVSQQSMALDSQEKSYIRTQELLKKMKKIALSPYFGRLDFLEQGAMSPSRLYIGTFSVIDDETNNILVYDWRAPIATMFYDYDLGSASYTSPIGVKEGVISLKRQYIIQDGLLMNMFETDVHIRDELLLNLLSRGTDEKLRNIAATIQREQNQIIRNEKHRVLVVQGVAGSGKTTAALHRIAYLLYKYRNLISVEQLVLFSPNPIFMDYITNVLPDLGEHNVRQMTFIQYKQEKLSRDWAVEDFYEQMEFLLGLQPNLPYKIKESSINFKTSSIFLSIINNYVNSLHHEGLMFKDIYLSDYLLISSEQLNKMFYEELISYTLPRRVVKIHEHIEMELEKLRKKMTRELYFKTAKIPKYLGADDEMKKWSINEIKKQIAPVKEMLNEVNFINFKDMYLRLFKDNDFIGNLVELNQLPMEWSEIKKGTVSSFEAGIIPFEDSTPFLFLREIVVGFNAYKNIRHVVFDEAQDYSIFDLEFFKKMFPNSQMTLLGDINQSIYCNTNLKDNGKIKEIYGEENVGIIQLDKSYRSTLEIVNFTSSLLGKENKIHAFGRNGTKPKIVYINNGSDDKVGRNICSDFNEMRKNSINSIAVICKTAKESNKVYQVLKPIISDIQHITKETRSYNGNCFVIPSYFAKGLEFDGVIIFDISQYHHEGELNLLYTACTRALHSLLIYNLTKQAPVFQLNEALIDIIHRNDLFI